MYVMDVSTRKSRHFKRYMNPVMLRIPCLKRAFKCVPFLNSDIRHGKFIEKGTTVESLVQKHDSEKSLAPKMVKKSGIMCRGWHYITCILLNLRNNGL